MAIKDDYYIKEINYTTAMNVVVKCHYAHRTAPYTHAFGLFSKHPNKLVGVVVYGSSINKDLCEQLCGKEEVDNIYELTRLYVDDGLPRNLESYLVGNTMKLLDKEIIISYSDMGFGHFGVIYQATNFYYTGLSQSGHFDYVEIEENGHELHGKTVCEKYGGAEGIRKAIENGANIMRKERSCKHRYVYFNCNKKRKKELLSKLKYPILPYPKSNTSVPITSTVNISDGRKGRLF